ncbi:MAG TPA: sigma 54-interacting transcriptional regulator [Kofleriaceae bacterium]|nr:sigma 54-interacting transcriptional regulator [Kofleriaceae bacterium]
MSDRLRRERDLFLALLELNRRRTLRPALEDTLDMVVSAIHADQGYLEIYDDDLDAPRWSIARGCSADEVDQIRKRVSRGIVAAALASGETIQTSSALLDDRFSARASVREQSIGAVLCAPLGDEVGIGALYVQRAAAAGPFDPDDVALVESFSRHVAPVLAQLIAREAEERGPDPTQAWRAGLCVEALVGRSQAMADVLRHVAMVAPKTVSVLITGSSGTGKTAVAKAIHASGARRNEPFIEVSCAAMPDDLIESELFGAIAGSHSTAHRSMTGRIAAAEGGTLFLDEVGEMSPRMQAKLLQLLQSKTYHPLGSPKPVLADVRIIAATNADLEDMVREKRFREDLYYRLSVLPIRMPDLRERAGDIRLLAQHFCQLFSDSELRVSLSDSALRALELADWPGNIRQLTNAVQAGVIRAQSERATLVAPRHLLPQSADPPPGDSERSFHDAIRDYQKELLLRALTRNDWNVSEAARSLDLARSTMNSLIRQHGLRRAAP